MIALCSDCRSVRVGRVDTSQVFRRLVHSHALPEHFERLALASLFHAGDLDGLYGRFFGEGEVPVFKC